MRSGNARDLRDNRAPCHLLFRHFAFMPGHVPASTSHNTACVLKTWASSQLLRVDPRG
jgi:hypothetical protein